jgi:predicted NBD/HSP70 family sugar kinase
MPPCSVRHLLTLRNGADSVQTKTAMSTPFALGPDAGAVSTRRLNRQRVLDVVRRLGPLSRADLSKRTQLSPPTVSALVDELTTGVALLREIGIGASSGGRPPILLEFNADFGTVAGVDIGPDGVRVALADLQGRVVARHHEPYPALSSGPQVDLVCAAVETLLARAGRASQRLFGIGVGAPGQADVTGRVNAPSVPGWSDVPLGDLLTTRFKVPVLVDSHANFAAIGERWQGAAQGIGDFVFLALGTRVGAGIVIDGRLHRGHQWQAGDISGLMLDVPGAPSAPEMPSMLQRLVASVITLLDPALVVCGGSLMAAHPEFVDRLRTAVSAIVPHVPAIERSALGDEATLLGAVHGAKELADGQVFAIAGGARAQPRAESA